jgi:2-desacetyl-2-hydroxyethyl bacteriochlorophyllide A dehydrogenase
VAERVKRRTVVFESPRRVGVREEDVPTPAANQVLVATTVSAISAGTELLFYRGEAPSDVAVDETIAALSGELRYPLIYGYACVGEVIEAGEGVDSAWVGRLVFAFSPHTSHFLASVSDLIAVPSELAPEEAVFLPNMETAVNLVMDGHPLIGERVVIMGQGVVGLLTCGLLAAHPLARLVTLDRCANRRKWSRALGATHCFDPVTPDLARQVAALWETHESPTGADLIFELTGNPEALDLAIDLAGYDSRIVIGSWYGRKRWPIGLGGRFHRSRIQLISSQVSTIAPRWSGRWNKERRFGTAWKMIERLRPAQLITHRLPVVAAAEAYALLDQHPCEAIQVVFTY